MTQVLDQRRYDIDWLRSLAFFILILYHVGMYYVLDWGWHIKSPNQSVWLQDVMVLTNQWRMSLLFFISGMAMALVDGKISRWTLVKIRTTKLFIPLVFGMFVVVAPQVYYEGLSQHLFEPGYWAFWQDYINPNTELLAEHHGPIGLLTWNHLWFLPYLWCYGLILLAFSPLLNRLIRWPCFQRLSGKVCLFLVIISLTCIWFFLRKPFPVTHDLFSDWYNHGKYFLVFIAGFALVKLPVVWQNLIDSRRVFLLVAIGCYIFITLDRHQMFQALASFYETSNAVRLFYGSIYVTNHWMWIFAIMGYAGRYLQFSNAFLQYVSGAILPWYILHQTLIVVFAANLQVWQIPPWIEAPILILLTSFGCLLGYEFVRRTQVLKLFFGIK